MTDIGYLEARQERLRCRCGHPRSKHAQASHKHHELGACKGHVDTPIGKSACPCHEYAPVREETT